MNKDYVLDLIQKKNNGLWELSDYVFRGLLIIYKYFPNQEIITGSSNDIIYSVDINDLIKKNITEKDIITLINDNWFIDNEDYLYHYV
jgi:hypothetical protein